MSKSKITVANYIKTQIELSSKQQKEIAAECGYMNPNIMSMIKNGLTKLPITKVGTLAKALGVDPLHLLRLTMSEYMPDTYQVLEEVVGTALVSEGEMQVVQLVRENTGGLDLSLAKNEHRIELAKLIGKIYAEENPTISRVAATKK